MGIDGIDSLKPDTTIFQWLIERGQPEGEEQTVWLEHSRYNPARDKTWTINPLAAAMFGTKEAAEKYIMENQLEARAVEHSFS